MKLVGVSERPALLEIGNVAGIAQARVTDALSAYRDALIGLARTYPGKTA